MGKKWRTNKNSNRKHKRTKTKRMRMRGGLNMNPFAKKVTNADIVRYLIKQTPPKPIEVKFIVPKKSMLSSNTDAPIDKTVIFDKLEDMKGKLHDINLSDKTVSFIIENDILRVNKEGENLTSFKDIVNRTITFVTDIKNEVREDMINTEKQDKATKEQEENDAKVKKEQEDQAEQEKNRILEEKKANTPKIIKVNLLDTRTQKGMIRTTSIDWNKKYVDYNKSTQGEDVFTKIQVPAKEDNTWNFDFFLRCVALNHDIDNLDIKQKPILEQIIQSDLKTSPLTYTDDTSSEIKLTNPGLIYMAIPGKPETYGGCIIYDMDGILSTHIQIHTSLEEGAMIEYDDEKKHPSVIMEEYLQDLFPQFKPPPVEEVETSTEESTTAVAEGTPTAESTPNAEVAQETVETTTEVAPATVETTTEVVAPETVETTTEVAPTTEVVTPETVETTTAPTPETVETTRAPTPSKNVVVPGKNITPLTEKTDENTEQNITTSNKPKEQPKKQMDSKINDELDELLKNILLEFI
jgi:hypothetical protein